MPQTTPNDATADWVRAERRKQNAVVVAVVLACLLFAFFPRNERRLFTFPGEGSLIETIAAPFQTALRDDGLSPAKRKKPGRFEMVLPTAQPHLDDFVVHEPWLGQILITEPQTFDIPLPNPIVPDLTPGKPEHLLTYTFKPYRFGPPPVVFGGVPEPGTWLMLLSGIALITWRMRAQQRRELKRRGHRRWRRQLVPAPMQPPSG